MDHFIFIINIIVIYCYNKSYLNHQIYLFKNTTLSDFNPNIVFTVHNKLLVRGQILIKQKYLVKHIRKNRVSLHYLFQKHK